MPSDEVDPQPTGNEWDDDEVTPGEPEAAADATRAELSRLHAELDDARSKYLRSIADFQNYQRRALQNEQVARQGGITSVAQNVINVIDHCDIALTHDASLASAEQVMQGLRVIRDELVKAMQQVGVRVIHPERGEEFVPGIHEAVMQQADKTVDPGHVVTTFQPGYALGERIIRAAKVVVAATL